MTKLCDFKRSNFQVLTWLKYKTDKNTQQIVQISFFLQQSICTCTFSVTLNVQSVPSLISFLYTLIIAFAKLLRITIHAASAFAFYPHATPFPF